MRVGGALSVLVVLQYSLSVWARNKARKTHLCIIERFVELWMWEKSEQVGQEHPMCHHRDVRLTPCMQPAHELLSTPSEGSTQSVTIRVMSVVSARK